MSNDIDAFFDAVDGQLERARRDRRSSAAAAAAAEEQAPAGELTGSAHSPSVIHSPPRVCACVPTLCTVLLIPLSGGPAPAARGGNGASGGGDALSEFLSDQSVPDAPADDLLQRMRAALTAHTKALADMRHTLSDSNSEAANDENFTININMVTSETGRQRERNAGSGHVPATHSLHAAVLVGSFSVCRNPPMVLAFCRWL
jgi:hypothetical protein